ncbi:hypothetical protein SERLADRAFT_431797 [Serpula lacrymans var. lacrymans S7.9]|uniref:Uncharacterized protein n=1 Tax=Serpula lacrymans var. lacrymans (strain S7.9) TaxID=578457 RepID=F8NDF6_SERL9|nr:uncharacterized protein SERLADRAFT_431797 [Serpula lacrymans var. lacrymans S7.9]EGO30294.1 hypothetical protein SERLADRAFT_431797 [Serpula lacrymans var. lacrymans S7.9]
MDETKLPLIHILLLITVLARLLTAIIVTNLPHLVQNTISLLWLQSQLEMQASILFIPLTHTALSNLMPTLIGMQTQDNTSDL